MLLKKTLFFGRMVFLLAGLGLIAWGYVSGFYHILLWGIMALFFSNVLHGLHDWKNRLIYLVFQFMIFTFLLSRPFISMVRGEYWWYFNSGAVTFALTVLWVTLLCLQLGVSLVEHFCKFDPKKIPKTPITVPTAYKGDTDGMKNLRLVALIFYLLTFAFFLLVQGERLLFIRTHDYAEIYTSFRQSLPGFVYTVSAMAKYGLCIFLATFPKKRWAYVTLILWVLGGLPDLIIGIRNTIVLNILFAFVYFLLRDVLEQRSYWVGKIEKTAIILLLPAALIFLGVYNYVREGQDVTLGIWDSIVDLFYRQGVTFDVLCLGYDALPKLPDAVPKNYTFGPFIDYFTRGTFGQYFFGTESLGSANSEALAVYGNSFAHSMSYVAHPEYLEGHGWGSSYILELFADWGYLGVIFGSTLLGALMRWMVEGLKKSPFVRTVLLLGLMGLFFIPRAEATGWLSFVLTLQFWLAWGFCFLLASTLNKKYSVSLGKKVV